MIIQILKIKIFLNAIYIMDITISKSKNPLKKYDAVINNKKKVSFGDPKYQDYTQNKDPDRKAKYIARHAKEDWSKSNVASPAWMSRYILWERPTLKGAIENANKKYKDVSITYKK